MLDTNTELFLDWSHPAQNEIRSARAGRRDGRRNIPLAVCPPTTTTVRTRYASRVTHTSDGGIHIHIYNRCLGPPEIMAGVHVYTIFPWIVFLSNISRTGCRESSSGQTTAEKRSVLVHSVYRVCLLLLGSFPGASDKWPYSSIMSPKAWP